MEKSKLKKTSKPGTRKKAKKKPAKKKGAIPGRDAKGKFIKGHKENETWTENTVLPIVKAIWDTLTEPLDPDSIIPGKPFNVVRANDIKLLGEVCIMHSVSKQRWNEWKEKFAPTLKDGIKINPLFSAPITDLMGNIKWLLECRLNYSGSSMDVFILKNHYEYRDQHQVDATTKGESINNPFYEFLKATSSISGSKP